MSTLSHRDAGEAAFAAGEFAAARDHFDRAVAADRQDARAVFGRGRARFRLEDYDAAIDDIERALQLGFDEREARLLKIEAHRLLGIYDPVIADCERLLAATPDDARLLFLRGEALDSEGDPEAALADFERAEALGIRHAQLFARKSDSLNSLDREDEAIEALAESCRRDADPPYDPGDYHSRAHTWQRFGRHDEALADFARAVALEPDSTHHLNCRSGLFFELDRISEAEADLDRIAELENRSDSMAEKTIIHPFVIELFGDAPLDSLSVTNRRFPSRAIADLHVAFETLPTAGVEVVKFFSAQYCGQPLQTFEQVYNRDRRNPVTSSPPKYMEIDIGEDEPIRALQDGLWLLKFAGEPLAVVFFGDYNGLHVIAASHGTPAGTAAANKLFKHIEDAIAKSRCYRGKVLSLESKEMYNGQGLGVMVHRIREVKRDEVILPAKTLDLLDRNVMAFVKQRPMLGKLGLAVKKGLLFYGPPGTGKTHTIHYLAGTIPGHTTFLISAEQVGNLSEYMTLARLLEPSMVVIEDVDLIARDRAEMRSAHEEVLLNKLLNEMDGLKANTEILFVLTTNRPEALEAALASRPGRVDQAIEFPLPNPEGRAKLVRLYSQGVPISDALVQTTVIRTDNVAASFIKELMRRAIQLALMRGEAELRIAESDVDGALDEMLVTGGSLNRKLLGAHPGE